MLTSQIADTSPQPNAIEQLCWPRHPVGYAGGGRPQPDDWIDDLRAHGVKLGDAISFTSEDILTRFRLVVQQDGAYRCDPDDIMPPAHVFVPASIKLITDQGHTADSLSGLLAQFGDEPPWLYPLDFQCRISHVHEPRACILTLAAGRARFACHLELSA